MSNHCCEVSIQHQHLELVADVMEFSLHTERSLVYRKGITLERPPRILKRSTTKLIIAVFSAILLLIFYSAVLVMIYP